MTEADEYDINEKQHAEITAMNPVELRELKSMMPECGEDFCPHCGDCLHCYYIVGGY